MDRWLRRRQEKLANIDYSAIGKGPISIFLPNFQSKSALFSQEEDKLNMTLFSRENIKEENSGRTHLKAHKIFEISQSYYTRYWILG